MPTSQGLEGKCAVVFGAGGSIGAAVAKELASEGRRHDRYWLTRRVRSRPKHAALRSFGLPSLRGG
jgi:NAD(P)-dependent dehydrogenase (short-subunit alcohol dehydrogenase family)